MGNKETINEPVETYGQTNLALTNYTFEKRKIEVFDETFVIREGVKKIVETKIYERADLQ